MIPEITPVMPNHDTRRWVAKVLAKFPFITWDRYVYNKEIEAMAAYGWIKREGDAYMDFVAVNFDVKLQTSQLIATSSAKYSNELAQAFGNDGHVACQRIEHAFKIENCVKEGG